MAIMTKPVGDCDEDGSSARLLASEDHWLALGFLTVEAFLRPENHLVENQELFSTASVEGSDERGGSVATAAG